jgi:hypothetical protein
MSLAHTAAGFVIDAYVVSLRACKLFGDRHPRVSFLSRFRTDICVRYRPQYIAVACVYLASKFLNVPLPESWFLTQFPQDPACLPVLEGWCGWCVSS